MTNTQALARIYETYTEEELRIARDEPDTGVAERFTGRAALTFLFGDDPQGTNATRRRVKRGFASTGHGMSSKAALANARRIFRRDTRRRA